MPKGKTSARRPRLPCLLAVLFALPLLLGAGYLLLRLAGDFLITSDTIKKCDAVVVLGGGDNERIAQAVKLVNDRYGSVLIITEPGVVKPGEKPASDAVRIQAIEAGLSPNAVLISDEIVASTYDEARSVRKLMEAQGMKSVIVVTDSYHTTRARMIFRDAFDESGLVVRIYPVQHTWYRPDTWFLSADGWAATIREYVKLAGYLLRR